MKRLIVSAKASQLFGDFLFVVSVSKEEDGKPVTKLKKEHFEIHYVASKNHASAYQRQVKSIKEKPSGVYVVQLENNPIQPNYFPGRFVFSVAVRKYYPVIGVAGERPQRPTKYDFGQTLATGELVD